MLTMEASRIRNLFRDRNDIKVFFDRSEFGRNVQNLPDLTIPNFHVAYENLKDRLTFIKQAFYAGFIVTPDSESIINEAKKMSDNIQSTEVLEPLDAFVFRTIIEECKVDLDHIDKVTHIKWTHKVRQFQHLIDNNWNIVFPKFENQLKLRQAFIFTSTRLFRHT